MKRIAFAFLCLLAASASAHADSLRDSTPNIVVTGEAFEDAAPDRATLFIGVVTDRPTALEAADDNARKAQSIVDELAAQGIEAKDVQTQGLTLAPYVSQEQDPRGKRTVKGFRARNELSVTIRELDKASAIAQRAIDSGANEVLGVSFSISDEGQRLDRLREAAMKDALRRARIYVEAIDLKLGRVIEIRPEGVSSAQRMSFHPAAPVAAAAPAESGVPLKPGLQKLSARVTVIWALTR
jgi:uncharacterized protein